MGSQFTIANHGEGVLAFFVSMPAMKTHPLRGYLMKNLRIVSLRNIVTDVWGIKYDPDGALPSPTEFHSIAFRLRITASWKHR